MATSNTAAPLASNKPAHSIRLGTIKAVIWANHVKRVGLIHNVNVVRIYRDDAGVWHDTHSFGRDDLLSAAKVLDLAHTWIHEHGKEGAEPETVPPDAR